MSNPLGDYKSLTAAERRKVLLLEYRCARGCLLLHVFASPAGPVYYRPALRVSKSMQVRTGMAEVGRVPELAGLLDELSIEPVAWGATENSLLIGCAHCIGVHFPVSTIKGDVEEAVPGSPVKHHNFWMTPNPPK